VYNIAMRYYEVSPTKIFRSSGDTLTYSFSEKLPIGLVVNIPLGRQTTTGIIIKEVQKPSYETRDIHSIIEHTPLPGYLIKLATWLSTFYSTPLPTIWQTMLPAGLNTTRRKQIFEARDAIRKRTHFLLNKDQSLAVSSIMSTSGTHLLHGVTGSGKTAVYSELINKCFKINKSAIVLVPEIALTSQLVDEFMQQFPGRVLLTHSKQTPAQRHIAWRTCLVSKQPLVVLGPRSALFMPLKDLGLIVIDECHEPSYKQDKSPRYSALRAASMLARYHDARLVLGSATPNIVDFYLAKSQNKIHRLNKPARNINLPVISIIDATKRTEFSSHRFIARSALSAIEKRLESKEQVLIFHNRRGSTTTTLCDNCGWQALCTSCFLPLTLHHDKYHLRCHACGQTHQVPTSCPDCSGTQIIHKGIGTKLIESELKKLFPTANIARFDTDTDKNETIESRYKELYDGNIDIIIGTQAIAKGLDLPKLRLVYVPQADSGLSLPDFSASERTFQLLSQVVGRVGRFEHSTQVIVQTYQVSHPVIQLGVEQNYSSFYKYALEERKRANFPPFTFLLQITCTYKTEKLAISNCKKLAKKLTLFDSSLIVSQPSPAFYERSPKGYRWQLLVKSTRRLNLLESIKLIPPGPHWQYDIDPVSLL
jgi:primosomal protein N' (replication factor Y)